jgi:DNA-binding NarL/FixJ family response regulator
MAQTAAVKSIPKIRILIADDQPPIRKIVRLILEADSRFEVCGEAIDGVQAIYEAGKLIPDVVIMNITMPRLDGFAAARELKRQLPDLAIVILSTHADKQFIAEAKKVGARAYVAKNKADESLIRAVDGAMITHGDFVLVA